MRKNGGNRTAAARVAYNVTSDASAGALGSVVYKSVENILEKDFEKIGLSKEFLVKCLIDDIKKKKGNRTREIDLAAKLGGFYEAKKTVETTENVSFESLLGEVDDRDLIEGDVIDDDTANSEEEGVNTEAI